MNQRPSITPTTKIGWTTSDGCFFENEKAAEIHEDHVLIQNELKGVILDFPSLSFDSSDDLNEFLEALSTKVLINCTPNYRITNGVLEPIQKDAA